MTDPDTDDGDGSDSMSDAAFNDAVLTWLRDRSSDDIAQWVEQGGHCDMTPADVARDQGNEPAENQVGPVVVTLTRAYQEAHDVETVDLEPGRPVTPAGRREAGELVVEFRERFTVRPPDEITDYVQARDWFWNYYGEIGGDILDFRDSDNYEVLAVRPREADQDGGSQ